MLIAKFDNENVNAEIERYEQDYHFTFPQQYREFLLKYNGGETPDTNFKLQRISSDLCGFYGFGKADPLYLIDQFREMGMLSDYMEDGMFPIGDNVYGDHVFICVAERNAGAIFFRQHDVPKKYIKLTDTFKEFVDKCKSKKAPKVCSIEERIAIRTANGITEPPPQVALDTWQKAIDTYNRLEELVLD